MPCTPRSAISTPCYFPRTTKFEPTRAHTRSPCVTKKQIKGRLKFLAPTLAKNKGDKFAEENGATADNFALDDCSALSHRCDMG